MTVVECPYCGLAVVEIGPAGASPLPSLRDGLIDPDGRLFGLRGRGSHPCAGYQLAARIYDHAGAES